MDIYSAEQYVQKLLTFVKGISDRKPNMYSKSKDRLRSLALTCLQVNKVISDILQEEILLDDRGEFGADIDLHKVVAEMQSELDSLRQFIPSSAKVADSSSASSIDRRAVMMKYRDTLKYVAENCPHPVASDCAKLIWTWFDTRFYRVTSSKFRYNIQRVPVWIHDIVILYGYNVACHTEKQFRDAVFSWCDTLFIGDAKDKYAVPYVVYEYNKSPDRAKLTLAAPVLFDMLVHSGLHTLSRCEVPLLDDCVYETCASSNPDVLDNYMNYLDHPEVLQCLMDANY